MRAEADSGAMPGVTTERLAEMAKLKREDAELRETNDISKAAASLFARELDRRRPASVGTIDDAALIARFHQNSGMKTGTVQVSFLSG